MRLEKAFHLSFYLTLGLACACLGYAQYPLLPEIALLVWPMGLALLVGYLVEGRWSLSIGAANAVAVLIAAVVGIWAFYRLVTPPGGGDGQPTPVRLLPHLGSLLIILMLAKLFRPKRLTDYWFLYGMAFVAVALACALDSDFLFGLLLFGFMTCALWSLALFYLRCGLQSAPAQQTVGPISWRGLGFAQALRRCVVIAGLAFVLFVLTPRSITSPLDGVPPRGSVLQTGLGDPVVDLHRTGTIRLNPTVAFDVLAENAQGAAKTDLDPGQRWRAGTLNNYDNGRWFNRAGPAVDPKAAADKKPPRLIAAQEPFPDLGPRQYYITLAFPRGSQRLLLAEPIVVTPDNRLLVQPLSGTVLAAWPVSAGVLPPAPRAQRCMYKQALVPPAEPGVQRPLPGDEPRRRYTEPVHVPGLRDWTVALLQRLVAAGRLQRADIIGAERGELLPVHHERVARAMEDYLANTGEYSYTLELRRRDTTIDPVFDFLSNLKQGHCERFATALAVMLRSLGVPARLIVGYRGAEHVGAGEYVVRHSDAHSWVEVLLHRPDGECWLTLDPTPADESTTADSSWASWWRSAQQGGGNVWRSFIVDYNSERQEAAVLEALQRLGLSDRVKERPAERAATSDGLPAWLWVVVGALAALAAWLVWRYWRRGAAPTAAVDAKGTPGFYGQFLRILARRRKLRPAPGQTPWEFAAAVGDRLGQEPRGAGLAELPAEIARLFYRVRYAAVPLSAAENADVARRLTELDVALAGTAAGK